MKPTSHTTKYQPDAAHIFPDFARIGPLQFTQLGAPLDFEIRFVALRCHDLNKEMKMIKKMNKRVCKLTLILIGAFTSSFISSPPPPPLPPKEGEFLDSCSAILTRVNQK